MKQYNGKLNGFLFAPWRQLWHAAIYGHEWETIDKGGWHPIGRCMIVKERCKICGWVRYICEK